MNIALVGGIERNEAELTQIELDHIVAGEQTSTHRPA